MKKGNKRQQTNKYLKTRGNIKKKQRKQTRKLRGGSWFFWKNDNNQNDTVEYSQTNPSFKYPLCSLAFENRAVLCEVCKHDVFHKIDVSVNRSKTATIGTNLLFEDSAEFISHPIRMYMCEKCHMCKMIYASTQWNKLHEGIYEVTPQKAIKSPESQRMARENVPPAIIH